MKLSIPSGLGLSILTLLAANLFAASSVDSVKSELLESHLRSAAVQQQIDQLQQVSSESDREYRTLLLQLDSTNAYNQQLQQRQTLQRQSLSAIDEQLVSVADIEREIKPLIKKMLQSLLNFVAADLPFLKVQRQADLVQLQLDIADLQLPDSDKYQKLLQAFLREERYSHAMQTYQGRLRGEGADVQVDYLQLGRVALYYQSLDGQKSALWSRQKNAWLPLGSSANKELRQAIEMAGGQAVDKLLSFNLTEGLMP